MKSKITLTIDEDILKKFKKYCNERGMKVSSKIELLIKKVIDNENK
jgi:antitoxin component of RelBE/YafQ-DinJ toxin-antitoxin module